MGLAKITEDTIFAESMIWWCGCDFIYFLFAIGRQFDTSFICKRQT